MSQENVEVVRAIYRAYELGDDRAVFERMHADIEWFGRVWTLRAGTAVRQRMFRDRLQALEAAGLAEDGPQT